MSCEQCRGWLRRRTAIAGRLDQLTAIAGRLDQHSTPTPSPELPAVDR
jgi:hypothetical protein